MKNELRNEDCIAALATMPDLSVEVMITDPPYPNFAKQFLESISDGYAGLYLATKKVKNTIVFFWSPRWPAPTPPPGWYEVGRNIWEKPDAKSNTTYEEIVVWSRDFRRQRSRVYNVPILDYRGLTDWHEHPTQKPLRLMRYLVENYTQPGD